MTSRDKKDRSRNSNERLKAVVRRLPPNLPEDIFWRSVELWVSDATASWKAYYPGKLSKRVNKENIPSRAYIAFRSEQHLLSFCKGYGGHIFRDKSGNEYQVVIEFAPYQKIASEKRKPDARMGTIERDDQYISFLQSLNSPPEAVVPIESLTASPPIFPKTTPLLEALKAEKLAAQEKEAANRATKDAPVPTLAARKTEEKKRTAAPTKPPSTKKTTSKRAAPVPADSTSTSGNIPTVVPSTAAKPAISASNKLSKINPPLRPAVRPLPKRITQPTPASITTDTALDTAPMSTAPPSARRGRPILGLGSRQFEAALSGVGASRDRTDKHSTLDNDKAEMKSTSHVLPSSTVLADTLKESTSNRTAASHMTNPSRGGKRGRGRGRGRGD